MDMPEEERERVLAFAKTRNGKLTEAIVEGMGEVIAPIVKDLQRRVAELEQNQTNYAGVWKPDTAYGKGPITGRFGSANARHASGLQAMTGH